MPCRSSTSQQKDFMEMNESNTNDPRWSVIRNGKRVLDVFRAKKLPVIQVKECHRPDMVDFERELDGSEDIHCVENRPENDYANLTYAANDVVLIVLWGLASVSDARYISVVVCFSAFLVNDIYGFLSWLKMKERQKESSSTN